MRELRHDFRVHYSCCYDEVPADEAVDLILTLPRGSLWRSAQIEFGEWTDEQERSADLVDMVSRFMHLYATRSTDGAWAVTRPSHMRARKAAREKAAEVRERIENTKWEEA